MVTPDRPPRMTIRDVTASDLRAVWRMNEAAVPYVTSITMEAFGQFAREATYFRVAEMRGQPVGFLVGLTPDATYTSPNFRWFCERYPAFVYVDRIVVGSTARRRGLGRLLYHDVIASAGPHAEFVTCEVYSKPRNETSLCFHRALGFVQVGELENGAKRVALLAKAL